MFYSRCVSSISFECCVPQLLGYNECDERLFQPCGQWQDRQFSNCIFVFTSCSRGRRTAMQSERSFLPIHTNPWSHRQHRDYRRQAMRVTMAGSPIRLGEHTWPRRVPRRHGQPLTAPARPAGCRPAPGCPKCTGNP